MVAGPVSGVMAGATAVVLAEPEVAGLLARAASGMLLGVLAFAAAIIIISERQIISMTDNFPCTGRVGRRGLVASRVVDGPMAAGMPLGALAGAAGVRVHGKLSVVEKLSAVLILLLLRPTARPTR